MLRSLWGAFVVWATDAAAPRSESNYSLRLRVEQAYHALNAVDIGKCLRLALPAATAAAGDDDLERLQIKEYACQCMCVALLQGLGKLDEAVFWWRERKRTVERIIQGFAYVDPRQQLFNAFWTSHVGHTALLGVHVKRNLLEGEPLRKLVLARPRGETPGNRRLVDYWQKYLTVIDYRMAEDTSPDVLYGSKYLFLEERPDGSETYFWQAYAEISQAWERSGGGALLELDSEDRQDGRSRLADMGVPQDAWFVCLHVRSMGFKSFHEQLQFPLNADIRSYDAAIDAIVERGGWVVRMGDPSMPQLAPRQGVVDYAHSYQKADWMDLFLCASCRFFIGTSSGLGYVPNLFGVPGVFTNWFPTGTRPLNSADLYIPKLHWYEAQAELAPFDESLAPPLGHVHAAPALRELGVSIRDNSAEDVRDVVLEMLDRLDGKAEYTDADRALQQRFGAVAEASRCFGNARIGRDFLRKHRELLA
jgi:putative glycosyltransferase (TIGR04372 family)